MCGKQPTEVWGRDYKKFFLDEQTEYLMEPGIFKRWSTLKAWQKRVLFVQLASRAHNRYLAEKAATHMKYCEHAGIAVSVTRKRVEIVKVYSNPTYEAPPFDYTKMGELKNLIHQSWKDDVVTASDL